MIQEFTLEELFRRSAEIVKFPLNDPKLIPTILPLIFGIIIIELYFGRYEEEKLGWNSAVANSTMLITTASILIYERFFRSKPLTNGLEVAFGILLIGLFILIMDFYHIWPKRIAYDVSSTLPLYYTVYAAIAITYGEIPLNKLTLVSTGLLFIILLGSFKWIEKMIEPVDGERDPEDIEGIKKDKNH